MTDKTLSERLRKYPTWATTELRNQMLEAADALDAKDAEIERLEGSKCDCPAIEQADKIDQQSALLAGAEKELEHARIFIVTQEKMHPDGVNLYDEVHAKIKARHV